LEHTAVMVRMAWFCVSAMYISSVLDREAFLNLPSPVGAKNWAGHPG
jgi:hypothetical protein